MITLKGVAPRKTKQTLFSNRQTARHKRKKRSDDNSRLIEKTNTPPNKASVWQHAPVSFAAKHLISCRRTLIVDFLL